MRAVFLLGLLAVGLVGGEDTKPIVDTHYGKVEGTTGISRDGRMYYEFKGIPYAKAERFEVAEIPDNWEGVKDATKYGARCVQYHPTAEKIIGEENCLFVNVFTPKLPKAGETAVLKPVVVVLHPGEHDHNSGELLGSKYFMDEDIVVVTLNNRLGVFGWLNTNSMYSNGNQAIKDQQLALRWVKVNIEKFGGDSDRVTILGVSSGASEAVIHLLAPKSKGLIHNAVVQSDNPLTPCAFVKDPVAQAKKLGEQVGCPTDSSKALVMCLKGMKAVDILKKMKHPKMEFQDMINVEDFAVFGPSIEKVLEGQTEKDVVLTDLPIKLLTDGKLESKLPVIIGVTDHDGLTPYTAVLLNSTENLKMLNDKWIEYAPKIFNFEKTAKEPKVVAQKIRDFYFQGKEVNEETLETLIDIFTDRYFASTTRYAAKYYTKHAPVYMYYFNHTTENHLLSTFNFNKDFQIKGAGHYDDIQYFFTVKDGDSKYFPEITKDSTPSELTLSKGLVKLWASFFENGKPTKTWGEGKEWKKLDTTDKPQWYKLGLETKNIDEEEYFAKRMAFWGELYGTQLTPEQVTPPQETF